MSRSEPWEAASVQCPFYLESGKNSIACEGHAEGIVTVSKFRLIQQKDEYMGARCIGDYKGCPVYIEAMKKY